METLLLENSTRRFFIEWGGFRSNHMSHGLVALHRLGASSQYLEKFAKRYQAILTPAHEHPEEFGGSIEAESLEALKGVRGRYYVVLDHFETTLKDKYCGDHEAMIRGEFPQLVLGLAGSALHGLIHTGYGLVAQSAQCVCEGLAYLHQSYLPLQLSEHAPALAGLGQGTKDILQVLQCVRQDQALSQAMFTDLHREDAVCKHRGKFQPRIGALLQHHGDTLAQYVQDIQFPAFFNAGSRTIEQLSQLLKWLVDCAIQVFVMAERRNDFVLIHGVTSSWSLQHILLLISDWDMGMEAVRTYLCVLLAVYIALETPRLHPHYLQQDCPLASWSEVVERTLAKDRDEHIYKLVQVCRDMDQENTTPEMSPIYKAAAFLAISEELSFL